MASSVGMYKLPSVGDVGPVTLPNCMYKLPNLQQIGPEQSAASSSNNMGSIDFSSLEKRQLDVLAELQAMQQKVQSFAARMCVALPPVPGSTTQQLVVHASPTNPPVAVLAVVRLIAEQLPCTTSVFVHSSMTGKVPEALMHFLDSCNTSGAEKKMEAVKVVLVWRQVDGDDPVLVARPGGSAGSQTPIRGQQNVTRYLCRVFLPHLYEGHGVLIASLVDAAIDTNAMVLSEGSGRSSKEKAAVLRGMNSQLGRSDFLVGKLLTLADILVYAALSSVKTPPQSGENVKKWMRRLAAIPAFDVLGRK